jgi:hypothetical protein
MLIEDSTNSQATLVRDYDFRQVNPKEEWEYKGVCFLQTKKNCSRGLILVDAAYFTVVPHGWPVFVSRKDAREA